jgi:GntR family transcriptional regulator, arabinose operon transcriptional repressor
VNAMIDRTSPIPFYYQIKRRLREQILSGELKPGNKLPSELDLARQNDISPMTVRQAYKELESESLISRRQGRGTFVNAQMPVSQAPRKRGVDVGILVNSLRGSGLFVAELLHGIEVASHSSGYHTHLLSSNGKNIQDADNYLLQAMFENRQIDGVIAIGSFGAAELEYLSARGIPVVFIDSDYRRSSIHAVLLDDAGYVQAWAEDLLAHGVKDIAVLCGEVSAEYPDIQRRGDRMADGFREAFKKARKRCPQDRVIHCQAADRSKVVRALLGSPPVPEAIIVNGDELTYELLQACAEMRISVPSDLLVINYGDGTHSPCCWLPKPLEEMGAQAVSLLRKLIKRTSAVAQKIILPLDRKRIDIRRIKGR